MTENNNNTTVSQEEETKLDTNEEKKIVIQQEILDKWALVPEKYIKAKGKGEIGEALEYFAAMKEKWEELYKDNMVGLATQLLYVRLNNTINTLVDRVGVIDAAVAAEVERLENSGEQGDVPELAEETVRRMQALLGAENLHYMKSDNTYYLQDKSGKWDLIKPASLRSGYGVVLNDTATPLIADMIEAAGRRMNKVVCTFKKCKHDELNIMNKGDWLTPAAGEYHPILDVLFSSLCDGNEAYMEMVERWLIYKYFKPEDHRLMALIFYGEGKVGKTEFVETILRSLFRGTDVEVLPAKSVFGDFNGEMLGNVVTMVDEFNRTKNFLDNVQMIVGNPTVNINVKSGIKGNFANTSGYIFAANTDAPLSLLNGSGTDVRYGLVPVSRNIILHTMIHLDMDTDHLLGKSPRECRADENFIEAEKWYNASLHMLSDNENVARWFGSKVVKHAEESFDSEGQFIMEKPMPLFDKNYVEAVGDNRSLVETFADKLFSHAQFRMITRKEVFKLYLAFAQDEGSGYHKSHNLDSNKFWRQLVRYITKKQFDVEIYEYDNRIKVTQEETGKRVNFSGIINPNCSKNRVIYEKQYQKCTQNGTEYVLDDWFDDDINDYVDDINSASQRRGRNNS